MDTKYPYTEVKQMIKRTKSLCTLLQVVFFTVLFVLMAFITPIDFHLGSLHLTHEALPLTVILPLMILSALLFRLGITLAQRPVITLFNKTCDPELAMTITKGMAKKNQQVDKKQHFVYVFFKGDFNTAMKNAQFDIEDILPSTKMIGFFGKARICFFTGEYESMNDAIEEFRNNLKQGTFFKKKEKELYKKIDAVLELMRALAQKDKEKLTAQFDHIAPWTPMGFTQLQTTYFKAEAAYLLDRRKQAESLFQTVVEQGKETFLCDRSKEYLRKIDET